MAGPSTWWEVSLAPWDDGSILPHPLSPLLFSLSCSPHFAHPYPLSATYMCKRTHTTHTHPLYSHLMQICSPEDLLLASHRVFVVSWYNVVSLHSKPKPVLFFNPSTHRLPHRLQTGHVCKPLLAVYALRGLRSPKHPGISVVRMAGGKGVDGQADKGDQWRSQPQEGPGDSLVRRGFQICHFYPETVRTSQTNKITVSWIQLRKHVLLTPLSGQEFLSAATYTDWSEGWWGSTSMHFSWAGRQEPKY